MGLPPGPEFLAWGEPAFNAAESCEGQGKGEHGEFPPKSSPRVQRDHEFRLQMSIPSSVFAQFACAKPPSRTLASGRPFERMSKSLEPYSPGARGSLPGPHRGSSNTGEASVRE